MSCLWNRRPDWKWYIYEYYNTDERKSDDVVTGLLGPLRTWTVRLTRDVWYWIDSIFLYFQNFESRFGSFLQYSIIHQDPAAPPGSFLGMADVNWGPPRTQRCLSTTTELPHLPITYFTFFFRNFCMMGLNKREVLMQHIVFAATNFSFFFMLKFFTFQTSACEWILFVWGVYV